jgi:hypothetical protein
MNEPEFDRKLAKAPTAEARIAWFGAILRKEAKSDVEIVGGSAIQIYLSSDVYVSQDVDIVGRKERIFPVLLRWGFEPVEGRSQRVYWLKKPIGLIDIVGPGDRSGLRPHELETPYGPVLVSAVEPLISRRLVRAQREHSDELFAQAVRLARVGEVDWSYLEAMAKYERVASLLKRLRQELQS